jgi:iron complex outermembrane receptor protein
MLKRTRISIAIGAAFGAGLVGLVQPVAAQQQPQQLERVEITGSAIRRTDAETSLPVTIIKAEELVKAGVTTAEQAIGRIAASQSLLGVSQGVGATTGGQAEASLRGLGGNKTLVLLNGRRVANHAYDSGSVDLNAIPLAAIDRIEVLRDGASAVYGTDAIGGVINFILRREFSGAELSFENQAPQQSNGDTNRASLTAGFGSLDRQGFNVFGSLDVRKQDVLQSTDRGFASTGNRPDRGILRTSGTSFPGDVGGYEPSLPNCAPPNSVPNGTGTACRYDFVRQIDLIPENEQTSVLLKGALKLGSSVASLEYLRAQNDTVVRVAPTPVSMLITQNNPFFPPGTPGTSIIDIDPVTPGVQAGGVVNWRVVPGGQRTNENETTNERVLLDFQGTLGSRWDYRAGLWNGKNQSEDTFTNGYINYDNIQAGLGITFDPVTGAVIYNPANAVINPFGPQTAAGAAAIQSGKVLGSVLKAKGDVKGLDARVTGDLAQLTAGPLAASFGAEFRQEKFDYDVQDITPQAASSGLELARDTTGKRDVTAVFAELSVPIVRTLEGTLQARFDNYSDSGNTFNPKVGLRWQPTKELLMRASFNTGFRAPTLYDIYQPQQLTFTADAYNDPVLCPTGTAIPPATPGVVCDQQVLLRFGGPAGYGQPVSTLEPEKSKTFTLGVLLEPTAGTVAGLDFWWINVRNTISSLPEQSIFEDPNKFASRIVRCSQLSPAARADVDVCLNFPTFDPIAYIDTPTENLGETKTAGVDLTLAHRFPKSAYGQWSVSLEGTYVNKYDYQRERNGVFLVNAGRYSDAGPIFRWQHLFQINWSAGAWSSTVSQRFKSSYRDQDEVSVVRQYSLWDWSVTWQPIKALTLSGGIKNVLNEEPPFSVQGTTFQANYDPRFTDPLGRTYTFRAAYKFF